MDETLMLETKPEVEAETQTEETTAEAEVDTTEQSAEEATEAQETDGQAAAEADTSTAEAAEAEAEEAPLPVVRVKYNKQERAFSVDEAAPLVEMGLKYESFKPEYEKLKDLASGYGFSVPEMIDHLAKQADDALYQKILEECDGNEKWAKREFESQKAERDGKIIAAREAEQNRLKQDEQDEQEKLHQRLANDFLELSKEEPGKFEKIADVPQKVMEDSIKSGRSLLDAYLRYERAESKKAAAVKAKQAESSKSSTGSMSGQAEVSTAPEIDAMLKGIWG